MSIRDAVERLAKEKPELFFVQIGANDGTTIDPNGKEHDPIAEFIEPYRWRGVMVEPVPWLFEKLRARHGGNPRLRFSDRAIADHCGTCTLWHVPPEKGLPWYDQQLASLRSNVVAKHTDIPKLMERMDKLSVRCEMLPALLDRFQAAQLDILVIDTEGYDYEVLKQMNFESSQPSVIYEHQHLTPPEFKAARRLLFDQGYLLAAEDRSDCFWAHE